MVKHNWMQTTIVAVVFGMAGCSFEDSALQQDLLRRQTANALAQAVSDSRIGNRLFQLVGQEQEGLERAGATTFANGGISQRIYTRLKEDLQDCATHGPQQTVCPVNLISAGALGNYGPLGTWLRGVQQKYADAQIIINNLPTGGVLIQVIDGQSNTLAQAQVADGEISGYVQETFNGPLAKVFLADGNGKNTSVKRVDGMALTGNEWNSLRNSDDNAAKPVRLSFQLEPNDFGPSHQETDGFTVEIRSGEVGESALSRQVQKERRQKLVQQQEKQTRQEQDYLEVEQSLQTVQSEKGQFEQQVSVLQTDLQRTQGERNGLQTNKSTLETDLQRVVGERNGLQIANATLQAELEKRTAQENLFLLAATALVPEGTLEQYLQTLIDKGAELNKQDAMGNTALHVATMANRRAVVTKLRKKGANGTVKNKFGQTPLHVAAEYNQVILVNPLTEDHVGGGAQALFGEEDGQKQTALLIAAKKDYHDMVKKLLKLDLMNAAIYKKDGTGFSPLLHAARLGHVESAKKLIDRITTIGVDKLRDGINDNDDKTAMHHAAENGHVEIVNYLIEKTNNLNSLITVMKANQDIRPLHLAAKNCHDDVVAALAPYVKYLDRLDKQDKSGNTALHYAASCGSPGSAQILRRNGAKSLHNGVCYPGQIASNLPKKVAIPQNNNNKPWQDLRKPNKDYFIDILYKKDLSFLFNPDGDSLFYKGNGELVK